MVKSQEEMFRDLKKKHLELYRDWKKCNKPCIICGKEAGNGRDHLPPKTLYPKQLRNDQTYFFTFPVCTSCNNGSSDQDFLFSILLSFGLNQDSYLNDEVPTNPDLLALHQQAQGQVEDPKLASHRQKLLIPHIGIDPKSGKEAINIDSLPTNKTITKIVKSIFWLQTEGDILQNYNPGWWIRSVVDPSKKQFIEKHLKVSNADIYWENKFISHYSIGYPKSGADGFISCSIHFYSNGSVKEGMSWYAIAAPSETFIGSESIYDLCLASFGAPTISPVTKK